MSDKFICAECKQEFEKCNSDQDAVNEKERLFPGLPWDMVVIVCDECFKEGMDRNEPGLHRYENLY